MSTLLALAGLLSSPVLAQDDPSAGLFTEARQLPLVSQAVTVRVDGDEATLHLTQVFANDGERLGQADYALHLPDGASVEGFGFWNHDRYLEAALQEKDEARAAHTEAATEGRATAIMDQEGAIHRFSVFPVEAGALKQVETTIRVPVEVEGGRRELRVPVDHFLGQAGATSTVTVHLDTPRPLEKVGISLADGTAVDHRVLRQEGTEALLAATSRHPLIVHWQEDAPPIDLSVAATETPDGTAVGLRVGLNQGGGSEPAWSHVVVIVDGSLSMQHRWATVAAAVDRAEASSARPVMVRTVADGRVFTGLFDEAGRRATWEDLDAVVRAEECGPAVRCLVITDAQVPELARFEAAPAEVLVLHDVHEAAHFAASLPPRAATFTPGVDPQARLNAAVDQAVLPVLEIDRLLVNGREVVPLKSGPHRVAEGGLLRMHGMLTDQTLADLQGSELIVEGRLDGAPLVRPLTVKAETADGRLRKAAYRDLLASWMRAWKDQPTDALRTRITEVSLREGIPTAFTSLQVDDPELSLVAIKPGDPTLTVDAAPGVTDVVAWYPFGDSRRLVRDTHAQKGEAWTDRFLVPRYWGERAYRVDIFSRHADGTVTRSDAWYVLDEAAPDARIAMQDGRLVIDTGEATPDIGAVELHAEGVVQRLGLDAGPAADAHTWSADAAALPERFTVVVRDRAGNVLRLPATVAEGRLSLEPGARPTAAPRLASRELPVTLDGEDVQLDGHRAVVHLADRSLSFDLRGLALRSVQLTAAAAIPDGRVLIGTRGGDLLALTCATDGSCTAATVQTGADEHPVSGIVALDDGRVLVGVLGQGLRLLDGARLVAAPWRVGSRFVTDLARADDGDVLVGTAYNGLWRITGGKALKTRFPHDHVDGLTAPGDLLASDPVLDLTVDSGFGRFSRVARDRYLYEGPGLNHRDVGADDLVDAVTVGDSVYVAGFDSGLWRRGPEGGLDPVPLDLHADEKRVNAVALHGGRLWLATEGGLLSLDPDRPETGVRRELPGAAHDLDSGRNGLAVASSEGLFVVAGGSARRVDLDGPLAHPMVGTGRYISVAWHGGDLYGGTLDGLVHLGAVDGGSFAAAPVTVADGLEASWITALHSDGASLWIGSYADGLWRLDEGGVTPAIAGQWVPPGALAQVGDTLWVGGIGMPAVSLDLSTGAVEALALPVRDVNAVTPDLDGRLLFVTSDGLATVGRSEVASR
ncbi:MAG: hypothetical protein H6742_21915 [Alphaproteobacteria bacterium]|nr:hypothetical protein [Alphaproteobacteria bacterium]